MENNTKFVIGVVLFVLALTLIFNVNITGMSIATFKDSSFESWSSNTALTSWVIDRVDWRKNADGSRLCYPTGMPSSTIINTVSKAIDKKLSGSFSVKFDLTQIGSVPILNCNPIVKQSNIPIKQNTDYIFTAFAYEQVQNTASASLLFGTWGGKYATCTRASIGNGWIKITCKGNSGSYTTAIVYVGTRFVGSVGSSAKVWFDYTSLDEGKCKDSDNGKNYGTAGICSVTYTTSTYNTPDKCNGNLLSEFYCSGDLQYCEVMNVTCSSIGYNSCSNGACVK